MSKIKQDEEMLTVNCALVTLFPVFPIVINLVKQEEVIHQNPKVRNLSLSGGQYHESN
jgi:hypothetical protein